MTFVGRFAITHSLPLVPILLLLALCLLIQVKKVLSQTIIAMAHHGYLEMEGGQMMIDFVVKQCSLPPDTVSFKHHLSGVSSQWFCQMAQQPEERDPNRRFVLKI